jgi:PhnB protein
MSVQAVTHLNFQGWTRAALAFYQQMFEGELRQSTYRDAGRTANPVELEHVVGGQVDAPNGFRIMAGDVASGAPWQQGENAFLVSLRSDTKEAIYALWGKLADGAAVLQCCRISRTPAGRRCTACSRTGLASCGSSM